MQETLKSLQTSSCDLIDIQVPSFQHFLGFTPALLPRFRAELDNFIKPLLNTTMAEVFANNQYHPDSMVVAAVAMSPEVPNGDSLYAKLLDERDDFRRAVMSLMLKN